MPSWRSPSWPRPASRAACRPTTWSWSTTSSPDGRVLAREIRDPGQAHLALAVDDAEATYERLAAAGVRFVTPPNAITAGVNAGGKACYFFGPDDIVHELLEPPLDRRRAYDERRPG